MAILLDPLFSDEARGSIAQVITFKRPYLFHPIASQCPYHPVTWSQAKTDQAKVWKSLCNQWRSLSNAQQAYWRDLAPGVLTGFNYFMQLKGQLPIGPCYDVPAGNALHFDFIDDTYSPPSGDSITFVWEECI